MVHRLQGGACWIRTKLSPLPELEVNKGKRHWLKCTNVFCPNALLARVWPVLSVQIVGRGLNIDRGKKEGRLGERVGILSLAPVLYCFSLVFPNARPVRFNVLPTIWLSEKAYKAKDRTLWLSKLYVFGCTYFKICRLINVDQTLYLM